MKNPLNPICEELKARLAALRISAEDANKRIHAIKTFSSAAKLAEIDRLTREVGALGESRRPPVFSSGRY